MLMHWDYGEILSVQVEYDWQTHNVNWHGTFFSVIVYSLEQLNLNLIERLSGAYL